MFKNKTVPRRKCHASRGPDRLFVNPSMELFAESESTFFVKIRPYLFVFTRSEGHLPQLEIVEGDETFHSKRIKAEP